MCLGKPRRQDEDQNRSDRSMRAHDEEEEHQNYSQMFRELEAQLVQYRTHQMRRLTLDPFFRIMNISPAARLWMIRHLKHLALRAEQRFNINLLEFFEDMTREQVHAFFRQKNAPTEIIEMWDHLHPVGEATGGAGRSPSSLVNNQPY